MSGTSGCSPFDLGCAVGTGIADAAGSVLGAIGSAITDGVGKAVASLGTMWVNVPTPTLGAIDGTPSDAVSFLQGSLWWYMAACAVVATIVGGARMALEQRGEPARKVVRGLCILAGVNASGTAVMAALVSAGDAFSVWIIARATNGTDFGTNVTAVLGLAALSGLGVIVVIVLGFLALISALVQIALMFARGAMLTVLAGLAPTSASFTSTEPGAAWFRRFVSWTAAFLLYKPVAAIIYATAFRMAGAKVFGGDGLGQAVAGLMLMILALAALPALMRFAVPFVAVMATDRRGGGGAAAGAAVGAAASGAQVVQVSRGAPGGAGGPGGSSSGGPSGSAMPSGGGSAPGAAGKGGAAAGGAAGGGAAAAAGPYAAAAGALVGAGQKAAGAVRKTADDTTGGPSGSGQ